jgi:hypothetical protein
MSKQDILQQIINDVNEARAAINKAYGFLPAKLWYKIERAKDALNLAAFEAHANKSQMASEVVDEEMKAKEE